MKVRNRKKTRQRKYVSLMWISKVRKDAWHEGYMKGRETERNEFVKLIIDFLRLDDRYEKSR
jgi:hypothetical protein